MAVAVFAPVGPVTLAPGGLGAVGGASAPTLTVIEGGLGSVAVTAAAAVPASATAAIFGTVLPLAASFAVGYAIGTKLLDLWNYINQTLQQVTVLPVADQPDTWPKPKPGQNVTYFYEWLAAGYFDPVVRRRFTWGSVNQPPSVSNIRPDVYYRGLGLCSVRNYGNYRGFVDWVIDAPWPGYARLIETQTSDGQPPEYATVAAGTAPSRAPIIKALDNSVLAASSIAVAPAAAPTTPVAFVQPHPQKEEKKPIAPVVPVTPTVPAFVPAGDPAPSPGPGQLPRITPGPGQRPATTPLPSTWPTIDPARPPLTISPAGDPVQQQKEATKITPQNLKYYLEAIVGDIASQPRPDLVSLAQEVGKIEQKTAKIMSDAARRQFDLPPEIIGWIKAIYDALQAKDDYGSYTLGGPCERDDQGNPIPFNETKVSFQWGGSYSALTNVSQRVDAIAQLIQQTMLFRQPTCKNMPPQGQLVSVQFKEIKR